MRSIDALEAHPPRKQDVLERACEALRESNPMLGTRGVRLGILFPELTRMQVRAIFEAACAGKPNEGRGSRLPEVMIPLTHHVRELEVQQVGARRRGAQR